jgi:hypothetical protein
MLVVGVAIMAVGYLLISIYKRTEWQLFVEHCMFGTDNPFGNGQGKHLHDGETHWSGGEFSEWKGDEEGVHHQANVLTSMLCAFTIAGQPTGAGSQIGLGFGAIPPNARLQIQFALTFKDDSKASPGYLIRLDDLGILATWGPTMSIALTPFRSERGLGSLMITFDRLHVGIVESSCAAVLLYGEDKTPAGDPVLTGTIPVHGQLVYEIIRPGRRGGSINVVSSLEAKEPQAHKSESHKSEAHTSEAHE